MTDHELRARVHAEVEYWRTFRRNIHRIADEIGDRGRIFDAIRHGSLPVEFQPLMQRASEPTFAAELAIKYIGEWMAADRQREQEAQVMHD